MSTSSSSRDAGNAEPHAFWTGLSLIVGGGVLGALSAIEIGDDETGPL